MNEVPLEEMLRVAADTRKASIGLPESQSLSDHRIPLTPEGAAVLVERRFRVLLEHGAADHIHYSDDAYARHGVEIVERDEAFGADIVVYLQHLSAADAKKVKRGALLLTFMHTAEEDRLPLEILVRRHVIALALDRITDEKGHRPFADILREIDGRAAIPVSWSFRSKL